MIPSEESDNQAPRESDSGRSDPGHAGRETTTVRSERSPAAGDPGDSDSAERKALSTLIPLRDGESTDGHGEFRRSDSGSGSGTHPSEPPGHWESMAGTTLGRYRIQEKVGEGGMAVVFRAQDSHLGRTVALKIPKIRPGDTEMQARFLREARAAASLHHAGICPIHDVGEIEGVDYLTMAFIAGQPLNKLISADQPFDPHEAAALVRKLAIALADAHEHGIVHRDLKPSNVMMNRHGDPIVMDFGLARRWDGAEARLTYSGAIVGTPAYMSPEQVEGPSESVGPPTDIYSLGVVLFELLTGRRPFEGSTAAILGMIAIQPPPAPTSLRPAIPPALDAICLKALAKKPDQRFATMRDFAAALEEYAPDLRSVGSGSRSRSGSAADAPDSKADTEIPAARKVSRSRKKVMWGSIGASLAVSLALLLVDFGKPPEKPAHPNNGDKTAEAGDRSGAPANGRNNAELPAVNLPLPESTNWKAHIDEAALTASATPWSIDSADPLAKDVLALFRAKCVECHSSDKRNGGLRVLDYDSLFQATETAGETVGPFLKAKDLKASPIWELVEHDKMPPEEPLGSDEKTLVKKWIEAGAPRWPERSHARPFVTEAAVLGAMRDDLKGAEEQDRRYLRYFSISALSNSHDATDETLRLTRAALSKACNSLSWEHEIALPKVVGAGGALLRIDVRDYGWDRQNHWIELLDANPYSLSYRRDEEAAVRALTEEISLLAGVELPLVRADWFIATAMRPPLYLQILELPEQLAELETKLGVDAVADFHRDRLVRGGVLQSGISRNNVIVDRHSSVFGSYWKSFDFDMSTGRGNILQYPLGPEFEGSKFSAVAFQHAAVKAIFRLPNGLQGYYLADASGRQVSEGPINVISDVRETSGTPAVVTGISCLACHTRGTIPFDDSVRSGLAVEGDAETKAKRLFGDGEKMTEHLDADRRQFLEAAQRATGPLLAVENEKDIDILRFPEPVTTVARTYARDVSLEDAAAELGINSAAKLREQIEGRVSLRKLGLGPLAAGGRIKRSVWSSRAEGFSVFQRTALELGIAIPSERAGTAP